MTATTMAMTGSIPTAAVADPFQGLIAATGPVSDPLAPLRRRAAETYLARGLPTRRDESWKYTDLKHLKAISFARASVADVMQPVDRLPRLLDEGRDAARLVFVNGGFRPDLSSPPPPTAGLTIRPLAEALSADSGDLVATVEDGAGSLPLVALNTALFEGGSLIDVPAAGGPDEIWLELVFVNGSSRAIAAAHRHLIQLGSGVRLGLVEHHLGANGQACFANGVTQVHLGKGAQLRHYRVVQGGRGLTTLLTTTADVGAEAAYESFSLTLGDAFSRIETDVRLNAPGAGCRIGGAYTIDGTAFCDHTTNVWHRRPKTTSRQVYRGAIDGRAHAVFQGRIVVEPGAQETDGHQLSKVLLLSDEAEIDQKPALEIFADNVKCSHGAAAGQLDAMALFYLRSRGLPDSVARQMLLEGFLADVLLEVSDEALRSALQEQIITRLRSLGKKEP